MMYGASASWVRMTRTARRDEDAAEDHRVPGRRELRRASASAGVAAGAPGTGDESTEQTLLTLRSAPVV